MCMRGGYGYDNHELLSNHSNVNACTLCSTILLHLYVTYIILMVTRRSTMCVSNLPAYICRSRHSAVLITAYISTYIHQTVDSLTRTAACCSCCCCCLVRPRSRRHGLLPVRYGALMAHVCRRAYRQLTHCLPPGALVQRRLV